MSITKEQQSKALLTLSMVIFGTIGIFRRHIPLSSGMIALLRGGIGVVFLLVFCLLRGRKLSLQSIKKNLLLLGISGAMIGFNWILLFESYQYTSVAIATLCYYMAPIFVIIVSPLFLREQLTWKKVICVLVALMGMVLVSGIFSQSPGKEGNLQGVLLGLGAAVLYAGVVILNKKISEISAYEKTITQLGMAAVVLLPYVLLTESVTTFAITPFVLGMVLIVGVVHTGIAYACYFGAMEKVKAQSIALFSYIDPVVAILLSTFLLKEKMGVYEITGTILILCATIVSEMSALKTTEEKVNG